MCDGFGIAPYTFLYCLCVQPHLFSSTAVEDLSAHFRGGRLSGRSTVSRLLSEGG